MVDRRVSDLLSTKKVDVTVRIRRTYTILLLFALEVTLNLLHVAMECAWNDTFFSLQNVHQARALLHKRSGATSPTA